MHPHQCLLTSNESACFTTGREYRNNMSDNQFLSLSPHKYTPKFVSPNIFGVLGSVVLFLNTTFPEKREGVKEVKRIADFLAVNRCHPPLSHTQLQNTRQAPSARVTAVRFFAVLLAKQVGSCSNRNRV
jgi:hypothetical protein